MTTDHTWNPNLYDTRHSFVTQYGAALFDLLDPRPGERILDLGCGTGHHAQQLAESGAQVVGLDASPEMVAQARASYPMIEFVVGNAADFRFDEPFDAVFSNAALHWVLTPEKVIASVWDALTPGGRFVAELGGRGNVQTLIDGVYDALVDLRHPRPAEFQWYFPSPAQYAALLEAQGFRVAYMAHFDRPTPLDGEDAIGPYLHMYLPWVLDRLNEGEEAAYIRAVEDRLRPSLYRDGQWVLDYVRLRFAALHP